MINQKPSLKSKPKLKGGTGPCLTITVSQANCHVDCVLLRLVHVVFIVMPLLLLESEQLRQSELVLRCQMIHTHKLIFKQNCNPSTHF